MKESDLKSVLFGKLRKRAPSAVVFRHEDKMTFNVPDGSFTSGGGTSWWEVKFSKNGKIEGQGSQALTMKRLANQGRAFYIIFADWRNFKTVSIVNNIDNWKMPKEPSDVVGANICPGFDHDWVVERMLELHR